jgi:hypothetical protein
MRAPLLVIAVVLLAAPAAARADEPDRARAQAAMEDYFAGEERGGYLLVGMGVAGLIAGGWLYRTGTPVARGASYPLLGVGAIHLAAGIFVNVASARRVEKFTQQIETDPSGFVAGERTRMKGVSRQFTALEITEVVLIAGGLGAAAFGWRTDRPRWQGAGLTLALEAACTLGFDVVAARRAHDYRVALDGTTVAASVDPDTGATTAMVGYAGRF